MIKSVIVLIILITVLFGGIYCFAKYAKKLKRIIKTIQGQISEIYYMMSDTSASHMDAGRMYKLDNTWSNDNPVICHALGEIDGYLFTESREAFEKHYEAGSRVFELDFGLTSDREVVVLHDWEGYFGRVLTLEEFKRVKILGKYTPLTLKAFIAMADKYQEARFIISVKSGSPAGSQEYNEDIRLIFNRIFSEAGAVNNDLTKRFILHAYSVEFLNAAMSEFDFKSVIYRLQNNIHPAVLARVLAECGVTAVTVTKEWYWSREYIGILHTNGIKLIACDLSKINTAKKHFKHYHPDMMMTPYGEELRR